jgi:hypothetical protein
MAKDPFATPTGKLPVVKLGGKSGGKPKAGKGEKAVFGAELKRHAPKKSKETEPKLNLGKRKK